MSTDYYFYCQDCRTRNDIPLSRGRFLEKWTNKRQLEDALSFIEHHIISNHHSVSSLMDTSGCHYKIKVCREYKDYSTCLIGDWNEELKRLDD